MLLFIEERESNLEADAAIVGAGAGLSVSAGYDFGGERLKKYFGDFVGKYGMIDMYTGCFADFETNEERWAYWSCWAWINRYEPIPKNTHQKLLKILEGKDYFILTTNIDYTFQRAGFPKERLCYTQGDFGLFQCSKPCHTDTYDNREILQKMVSQEKEMRVPTELIPHCPKCGREMGNITDAVLAATLKDLIANEIVIRKSYNEIPPRVEYSLSDKGKSVVPILQSICKWSGIFYKEDNQNTMVHCKKCDYR